MVFPYMTHLLAAMLLGALIGAERQWRQRMAGLRTNALVATGAAVFILSAMSASPDSPGRIAAQIVSGIGFLGAGVIMRDGMNVRGLNTAATLWCSAGIGVLCGLGQFWNATAATLIILCANILLREAAQRIHALPGAGDEEKRYVLRVTCLREHENAVRQLLLNIAQQQRFTLQGLQSAAADTADHLEICAQLISHKQHQKNAGANYGADGRSAERHIGALACRRGVGAGGGAAETAARRAIRHPAGKQLEWPPRRRL
ncbi:putative Mg(2+) transport ATPase [Klebsiella pneumoniae]|uniref:Protein MgtC n=2 Tax=Klebsiella pneumoniae complex TaxID=3390273 RepID=A0A377XDA7_KLEPN|nr:putative Mg(2+) transport ATPase [Klebsiella pneumoniae]